MSESETAKRIKRNPEIYRGRPIFRGTRIPIWVISDAQFHGMTPAEIIDDYPGLTLEDVEVAIAFIEKGEFEPWEMEPTLLAPTSRKFGDGHD